MAGSAVRHRITVFGAVALAVLTLSGCTRHSARPSVTVTPTRVVDVDADPSGLPGPVPSASSSSAPPRVTVTVNPTASGQVGTGFAGFSYEKDRIGAGVFDAHDTNLVNLFRLLGPGVVRLGANLVDIVNWNPVGLGGSANEVAPADVRKLAGFLRATGWKAIYGINLKTNTPANAASEAQFVAATLGTDLMAFEIGNEPNFYRTEVTYEQSYNAYVAAIVAKVPGAVFDGPGPASENTWLTPFATHERANRLAILSMHTYIAADTKASITGMLASTAPGGTLAGQWNALAAARTAGGIPQWRMTEANSYFHGGTAGVSDVQAAALWALDFMAGVAAHQGSGVNFHGGTSVQFPLHYTPIVFAGVAPTGVQAVYYAELLWSLAGPGAWHTATVSGASGVTAWGIGDNVILVNRGPTPVTVAVTLAAPAGRAKGYDLTAPALASRAVTIAGSGVTANGRFQPVPRPLPVSGTGVAVTVPAGSATLVVTA